MFIERLKDLLDENNLNQKTFANMAKIPYTTVNGWFTKNQQPNGSTLNTIANCLKCSTDYLLGREEAITIKSSTTPFENNLLTVVKKLTKEDQYQVLGFAMALAN